MHVDLAVVARCGPQDGGGGVNVPDVARAELVVPVGAGPGRRPPELVLADHGAAGGGGVRDRGYDEVPPDAGGGDDVEVGEPDLHREGLWSEKEMCRCVVRTRMYPLAADSPKCMGLGTPMMWNRSVVGVVMTPPVE